MILHSGLGFAKQFFSGGRWCGWIQLLVPLCDFETVVLPSVSCSLGILSLHVCCVLSASAPLCMSHAGWMAFFTQLQSPQESQDLLRLSPRPKTRHFHYVLLGVKESHGANQIQSREPDKGTST